MPAARSQPAGFALLVAMLVVFLVSMAVSLIGLSLALRMRTAQGEARATTLAALSDAALAEVLSAIAAGHALGLPPHRFGGGEIGSQIEVTSPGHLVVVATASFGGRSRYVLAEVLRDDQGTRVIHWQRLPG